MIWETTPIKNLEEIKRDYIRLCASEQGLWLEVCDVDWIGPHNPVEVWTPIKRLGQPPAPTRDERPKKLLHFIDIKPISLKLDAATQKELDAHWIATKHELEPRWVATPQEIEKAINQLLNNRRYFDICGRCRKLKPVGLMHGDFACQSCAEKFLDIVY
ncbi:hypothetical protein G4923_12530 [Aeromonas rivipollensis]|uniref:Uncharacterized protein n=1 Tax=Aeromonas rivipollensis TaxID=948519 RepID=A0ABX0D0H5_9GAMM|nr:hypothetical protein [Aeromonas rivipollensis]NEX89522.1 hypothetical protein [Aeromonas rivipollensis]NEY06720.1 hypothetical protein [Aeromonas rivipollensis]